MIAVLRLIRLPNLIIIAFSQALVRYCLIMPAFIAQYHNTGFFMPHLSKFDFILLVLSTVLIAAGGYIINDVFDTNIDEVNKPGKNIIGKKISETTAKKFFYFLSAAGIILGFFVAYNIEKLMMGFVNVFAVGSLWMYSSYYKKRLLIGNFIVAFLSALSLLIIGLYEPYYYMNIEFLLYYAAFAFLVSLIREIIKDAEDIDGDERAQCKTLPIIAGIKTTKGVVTSLIIITVAAIVFILTKYFYFNTVVSFWYLVSIFVIPFAALIYLVGTASEKKDFHYASVFTKLIMIAGVLSMVPFYFYFLR
jgi:4-hydroxybenzoate polyprenyltransferase